MLKRLWVDNYALISGLEMELAPSLNIITGETGAGKSILLGALGLILGNRADSSALKDNDRNCVVEGVFDLAGYNLAPFFEANDLEYDEQTVIRRVITPAGKSRAYVNDLPVQLTVLKELSLSLIDIHSQHQSRLLGEESFRIATLDSIVSEQATRAEYAAVYGAMRGAGRELAATRDEAARSRQDEEYLRFQYDRITALNLSEGEYAQLEATQRELAAAGDIMTALGVSGELLGGEDGGVLTSLKAVETALQGVAGAFPLSGELAARVRTAAIELRDVEAEVVSAAGRIDTDPRKLEAINARIGEIYALMQRHKLSSDAQLIEFGRSLAASLDRITGSEEAIAELERREAALRGEAQAIARRITSQRTEAAASLGADIGKLLERLGMSDGRFVCEVSPAGELSQTGADRVAFMFTANRSSTPQPLERIASGGELSRVMLALKAVVARRTMLPTIIFDEIDTGVSGRIADAMGAIIAELAESMQVINITHLPQVASKGDVHFLVYKETDAAGTRTHIRRLAPTERVEEVARMLSGSEVTEAALAQARLLIGGDGKR